MYKRVNGNINQLRAACVSFLPATADSIRRNTWFGEAKVDVTKDETVVRLAMAQHGSVLIELPANDGPRYIIPGDPEMAIPATLTEINTLLDPTTAFIEYVCN